MKKRLVSKIALLLLFEAPWVFGSSKVLNMELETQLIKVDLGIEYKSYFIDPAACICWVQDYKSSAPAPISTFECKKLKVYPSLQKYLEKCS